MSGQVTVPLPARCRGRHGRAGAAGAASPPTPDRIPRVARVLALAHHWQGLLRSGAVRNQADLARLVGVTRARVTQVMALLNLAPDIQESLLFTTGGEPWSLHRDLLSIATEPAWSQQRRLSSAAAE